MPSRALTDILDLIPPDFADPAADYVAVRRMMAPFHGHPVPAHVRVTEAELGGVRCAWYDDTRGPASDRIVFHCHGGALVSCPLDDYHFYGALLAERLAARVVMADYRLAPEHTFPAAHDDCLAAYRALLGGPDAVDARRVAVSGDSCGGLLGLGTLLAARDAGWPAAAAFVSISGWFDLAVAVEADRGGGRDPFLTAEWVRNTGRDYSAGLVALEDHASRRATPSWRGCRRSIWRWGSSTRSGRERWGWPRQRPRPGSTSRSRCGRAWCTAGRGW